MKKILTIAVTLFAVSAFAAGVVFKANPLELLSSSSGGGDNSSKKAKKEQVSSATSGEQVQTKQSFLQVGLAYQTISIQKSYNLATGEVTHNFNMITRSHVDEASKEQDDALFLADLTDLLKKHPELTYDGIAETFKRENTVLFEQAKQHVLKELPQGNKK